MSEMLESTSLQSGNRIERVERIKNLIESAQQKGCVARVCREFQISRSSFYRYMRLVQQGGYEAVKLRERKKPNMPNAFPPHIVDSILSLTARFPSYSYVRIAQKLSLQGIKVSASGVRKVWNRKNLNKKLQRIEWAKANKN